MTNELCEFGPNRRRAALNVLHRLATIALEEMTKATEDHDNDVHEAMTRPYRDALDIIHAIRTLQPKPEPAALFQGDFGPYREFTFFVAFGVNGPDRETAAEHLSNVLVPVAEGTYPEPGKAIVEEWWLAERRDKHVDRSDCTAYAVVEDEGAEGAAAILGLAR